MAHTLIYITRERERQREQANDTYGIFVISTCPGQLHPQESSKVAVKHCHYNEKLICMVNIDQERVTLHLCELECNKVFHQFCIT